MHVAADQDPVALDADHRGVEVHVGPPKRRQFAAPGAGVERQRPRRVQPILGGVGQEQPVWEATQHLVKRLETDGESSAAQLLRGLGGLGESAQLLAYRLYTVCEKSHPGLAGPYNALVASWPEIQRLASDATGPMTVAEQQSFTT
jgi:putative DNA methylase